MDQMMQLWEYQQKDMALDAFLAQLKDTPTRKRMVKLQKYLKSSQKKVNALETRALQAQGEMQSNEKQYASLEADMEELDKDISYYTENEDDQPDAAQMNDLVALAGKLVAKTAKLQEELQALQQEIDTADKTVRELLQKMLAAKKEYDALKVEHQKELDSGSEEQARLEAEAKAASEGISREMLEEYARIKGFRANPVAVLSANRCNGCNMQLPASVTGQVVKGDKVITCENCGRILIVMP